jgi:hypothetical protein
MINSMILLRIVCPSKTVTEYIEIIDVGEITPMIILSSNKSLINLKTDESLFKSLLHRLNVQAD